MPPGVLLDATVGGGGHAAALLTGLPAHELIGVDVDDDAVAEASARLARFGGRAQVVRARFDELPAVVRANAPGRPVAGILFDLGVSSPQVDTPERGFSYRFDGPLDMRMDRTGSTTASDVVNRLSIDELTALLAENGEGRFARRLAAGIVESRPDRDHLTARRGDRTLAARRGEKATRPPGKTGVPGTADLGQRRARGALARRSRAALDLLVPGGRCVVISYHSGEDRLVKATFAGAASGGCVCPSAFRVFAERCLRSAF